MTQRKGKEDFQRYVKLDDDMTNSTAWDSLSLAAIWIYIELRKKYNHTNGGFDRLILPRNEILHRMNHHTFAKKKRELIARGFIDCVDPGGLPQRPAIYRLSERWKAISRDLVTTMGREAIRSGVKRTFDEFTGKYSTQHLNFQKKEGKKKETDRYILKGGPKIGPYKRTLQGPKIGPYKPPGVNREKPLRPQNRALVGPQNRALRSKDKKLTKAQIIEARKKAKEWGIKYSREEDDIFNKAVNRMKDN